MFTQCISMIRFTRNLLIKVMTMIKLENLIYKIIYWQITLVYAFIYKYHLF